MSRLISKTYRGRTFYIKHTAGHDMCDVDIHGPDNYWASFELAVWNANAPNLQNRLAYTVECWIDGLLNRA